MTTQEVKPGIKFELLSNGEVLNAYQIIKVSETRVVFSDGRISAHGATNRRQKSSWLTIQGFINRLESGQYRIA